MTMEHKNSDLSMFKIFYSSSELSSISKTSLNSFWRFMYWTSFFLKFFSRLDIFSPTYMLILDSLHAEIGQAYSFSPNNRKSSFSEMDTVMFAWSWMTILNHDSIFNLVSSVTSKDFLTSFLTGAYEKLCWVK